MIVCTVALTHKFIIRLKAGPIAGTGEPPALIEAFAHGRIGSDQAEDEGNRRHISSYTRRHRE